MKLSTSLLALAAGAQAQLLISSITGASCIECEHVGYATSEDDAVAILATDDPGSKGINYCISGKKGSDAVPNPYTVLPAAWTASTVPSYCVAQFFIYYAKDVNKYAYGVRRFGSTANVNDGLIDAEGYDGIKAFQTSLKTDDTSGLGVSASGDGSSGPNPKFRQRGTAQQDDNSKTWQYMADGREDALASTATLSITPVQETPYTRCLICHGTQEFRTPPAISSEITDPCWNPSGSTTFSTDLEATLDPRRYCVPDDGFCSTTTWQYSTEDDAGATSSHWVGIERGCPNPQTDNNQLPTEPNGAGVSHTTKRGATNMKELVRYYPATNTASKAKDNAKYPDADVATNNAMSLSNYDGSVVSQLSTTSFTQMAASQYGIPDDIEGYAAPITPQFMSADGSGKPDLPTTVKVPELECLSCVTPIGNTDSTNTCVNAKTTGRVKCKTLSCASITSNYLLGDSSDKYYYAKRGCDADPEDGKADGEQDPADLPVVPAGWTNIKQYNQRTTTKNGNTGRSSSTSVAAIFDCYSCESSFSATVEGTNPVEPLYDAIKTRDTSLCWETYEPQTDTSVSSTGTSGSCIGNCYTQAYKFKETSGPVSNPTTVFNWYVKRGCEMDKAKITSGTTPSTDLFGVTVTNSVCTFQNGTLCNGKIEAYDTSLELKTQNVRKLQCYTCTTPAGNTDAADECYTVPSTAKATECDDLSFVSCFATQTSFLKDGVAQYGMSRGCSKDAPASKTEAVAEFTNVNAVTTGCSSSSCNKVPGKTDGLVEAVSSGARPDTTEGDADEEADAEDDEEVAEEAGAAAVTASALMLALALVH